MGPKVLKFGKFIDFNRNSIISERSRPKVKQVPNNVLEDLRQTFNNVEESKRRSDLESRLYSKWRLGLDQEKVLKESKNEHEAMAKLSWLDRQVEKQMTQEKEKRENNEIELKLQENKRKHEEYLKNCKEMRDSEMQQLKGLQENHVFELKSRERESHDLKLQESILRKKLGEIKKEIDNISTNGRVRRDRVVAMYNYRKLKMVLQSRSEAIQRELRQDINLLDRISFDKDFDNNEEISYLRQKFNTQLEKEIQNQRDIESMYESEAKQTLAKQEEKWNDDSMVREQQLKCLLESRIEAINDLINHSMKRQQEIIGVRESHLKSIEESNDRLKKLMTETISDDFNCLTNGHSNEMKDVCKKTDNLMIRQNTELCLPKFGRKRIVWT